MSKSEKAKPRLKLLLDGRVVKVRAQKKMRIRLQDAFTPDQVEAAVMLSLISPEWQVAMKIGAAIIHRMDVAPEREPELFARVLAAVWKAAEAYDQGTLP